MHLARVDPGPGRELPSRQFHRLVETFLGSRMRPEDVEWIDRKLQAGRILPGRARD